MIMRPTPKDPRDKRFRFHRLFGALQSTSYREINNDAHLTNPDQNFDNRPMACTSYAVTDIATDQDKQLYSHDFQFYKTLELMGSIDASQGADARKAFMVPVSIGLLPLEKEPPTMKTSSQNWVVNPANWPTSLNTETVHKPNLIPISRELGQDWFDAIYNALDRGFTVGLGTRWSPDFETADYLLPEDPKNLYWGHEYKVQGCTLINGEPHFLVKSWQAKKYKNGICVMNKKLCNKLMGEMGTYAATLAKLPTDVIDSAKQQQIFILETLVAYLQNLILLLAYHTGKLWSGLKSSSTG